MVQAIRLEPGLLESRELTETINRVKQNIVMVKCMVQRLKTFPAHEPSAVSMLLAGGSS